MATTPVKGSRVPVKLPWKGVTNNKDQFVAIKEYVAKFLKFDLATHNDLLYETEVNKKDKGDGPQGDVPGKVKVKRRRRPGYRQRSIKVVFQTGRPAEGGRKSTLVGAKQTVNGQAYASISFPVTKSVAIDDILEYFETGRGASLKARRIVDMNTGQSYPVIKPGA
jgi:hypothetical protein